MLIGSTNDNILYWHYSDFRKYQYFLLFSIVALITFSPARARSQIIPDNTLPNNSITIPEGNLVEIGGGTIRGENLFHSFSEFSVPENSTAWFNNSLSLENIFSRVTGGNISNIEGLIQTNGTANLFLLNPAGILFGENAALNVGGSLFVSTADSLIFSDGSQFSAVNPQEPPLLTVNIPIGLQYGSTPGQILVQGNGHGLFGDPATFAVNRDNRPVGLQVPSGETLALLGGEVRLEGGNLTAEAGNIEVWAVANDSQLLITNSNDGFSIEPASADLNYGDISLSQAASIDVSSNSSGNIRAQGRNITLTEGSAMAADTLGDGTGGLLEVTASELITLNGTTSNLDFGTSLSTEIGPSATGQGSDLIVNTERLLVSGGAAISSSNLGLGMPGDLIVIAPAFPPPTVRVEMLAPSVMDNCSVLMVMSPLFPVTEKTA